jgi:hypothetical protein
MSIDVVAEAVAVGPASDASADTPAHASASATRVNDRFAVNTGNAVMVHRVPGPDRRRNEFTEWENVRRPLRGEGAFRFLELLGAPHNPSQHPRHG